MINEQILFQYQVNTKSQYGTRYYYFYADTDIENYLNNKKIKYVRYAKDTALNKKEKRIKELFKENKQLQQKIDKTIEYIINKKYWDGINNYRLSNVDELLEILKGSDYEKGKFN